MAVTDLSPWIDKLKAVQQRSDLFRLLNEFRVLEWTDEQRSIIAKLYMRLLDVLPAEEQGESADQPKQAAASGSSEQEEVWYEKM